MRQLPTEIIHQIMLLLNQEQKVECMRACQSWERSVKKLSLFDTVRVSSMVALERLVKKVTVEPQQGYKVQRLIIDTIIDMSFDMAMLPILFPNLRFFYVWGWEVSQSSEEMFLDPWQKQLEFVGEQVGSSFTKRLLTNGICTQLKTLAFTLKYDEGNNLDLYANAPNLTTLILTGFKFQLEDLEILHRHLPLLVTLKLKYGSLINSGLPIDIEPATSILVLSAFQLRISQSDAYINLLQYIRQKYTNVTDLLLNFSWAEDCESKVNDILSLGWNPLFQYLGSNLHTLWLDPDTLPSGIFHVLDEANCHIKHLRLSEACLRTSKESLKTSHQRNSIETLVLEFQGRGVTGFYWLQFISKLRSLKVIFSIIPKEDKLINDILDHCPNTVESLAIENNKLNFDFTTLRQYAIKRLELKNVTLPSGMDTFLSLHIPKLNRLRLEGCEFNGDFFVLQNIHLHYLDIISRIPVDKQLVMVKTLGDQKGYMYIPRHKVNYYGIFRERLNIHDATLCPSVRALSMEETTTKTKPFLTIVCNSIRNLTIIDKQ
ncbi:hypothetical protein K501DRAFT_303082 [Backusella circina FSU 941]|nr:hypothetical protein K501DRAFT_303082 [Backusella circina FSU 941]